ncbi:unnamed protein product [Callosobruchus maculatus]|uniref:PWWP domain-containing protein n=1 Tax=Callosobruchus maculatus TaxID=64391 RepID=A0A653D2D0_CALMS|nr:unnamed protein product [Callosobruchus maculatus]
MASVVSNINLDKFVWAKVQGYSYWPALVLSPGPKADIPEKPVSSSGENYFWIYFFGTCDYAWVPERHVKPFTKCYDQYAYHNKSKVFQVALNDIGIHMQNIESNPEYEIGIEAFVKKRPKSRARKRRSNNMDPLEEDEQAKQIELWCEMLETENSSVSPVVIGVIGIGNIGRSIVGKLIQSGHIVNIWNRTTQKSDALKKDLDHNERLTVHDTPQSLLVHCDHIFICISDENELRLFLQDNFNMHNVKEKTLQDKGIIIMTSMSPETAKNMKDMIEKKGGRYLEALVQWSSIDNGRFILLAAGDESLFKSIQCCTKAFSSSAVFLGDAGYACCVYLVLQLIKGVCLAGLSESIHLAERCGLKVTDFRELFSRSQLYGKNRQ